MKVNLDILGIKKAAGKACTVGACDLPSQERQLKGKLAQAMRTETALRQDLASALSALAASNAEVDRLSNAVAELEDKLRRLQDRKPRKRVKADASPAEGN